MDLRLIDFANSTHGGLAPDTGGVLHAGPDLGFIFGLDTLLGILADLREGKVDVVEDDGDDGDDGGDGGDDGAAAAAAAAGDDDDDDVDDDDDDDDTTFGEDALSVNNE